ncbi:unnamed protein product [Prorocentrum cordatum]|uniref:Uncharacterized protein n=1 Tax=Prorocentrum cordatum TaxID=2364126 RepID=A0ABN9V0W4_9DINO|nr:unnamed protein product [Polarella glacialis]
MALKDALGEDWARDRETHVCLIGPAGDAQLAWALYEVLTEQLALRHVSVASGGFAAARACAVRLGLEAPPVGAGEARGGQPAEGAEEVGGALAGPPALRDRPGNWPGHVDMGELPSWPRKEICAKEGAYWQCIAVVVRSPQAQTVGAAPAALEWEGCASVLAVVGKRLVCAEAGASKQAAVYAEFEVSRVLKVTSKKQAPDVLIFYFREDERGQAAARASPGAGAAEPAMVLHFENGPDDVKAFIQVLKSSYSTALPQPVKTQEAAARGPARPAVAAVADQSLDEEEPGPRPSPLGAGLAAGAAAVSGPGRRGAA